MQNLPARHHDLQPEAGGKERGHVLHCTHNLLKVVKDQQNLVLYPSLRVEIPQLKIERVRGFPP